MTRDDDRPLTVADIATVLLAVAEMDSIALGDDDWPHCPFACDADVNFTPYDDVPRSHAHDCPITLARRLVDPDRIPYPLTTPR